ncbi:MAG: ATP-binding protein [Verrucomicrobiales bacterium]|nr:ATP-binding protein [Verrucomicrobiales bacterium]
MITRIEAVNYRCLRNTSQPLGRFHVMAGPNGSGKSTFLEVVRVLGAFASEGLEAVWDESKARQVSELLYRGAGHLFQLAIELPVPNSLFARIGRKNGPRKQVVRYEVELGGRSAKEVNEARIGSENLWLLDAATQTLQADVAQQEMLFPSPAKPESNLIHGQTKTPAGWRKVASKSSELNAYFKSETSDWNFTLKNGRRRSALSSLPEDERFGIANWAKGVLTQSVQKLALRSELMQAPCPPLKERKFSPDGSTLPLVVQDLKADSAAFKGWLEHLRTILPIKDVEVIEREEDKHTYLRAVYEDGLKVPSWHLSDGTLRLMALTLIPYLRLEGAIYLVEEPENGVHPQAVEAVFQSLSSVYEGQVLLATHSPVLVGLIKPAELLCFSKTQEGETDIVSGDRHPRLKQWQGELRLAQVFAAGILS